MLYSPWLLIPSASVYYMTIFLSITVTISREEEVSMKAGVDLELQTSESEDYQSRDHVGRSRCIPPDVYVQSKPLAVHGKVLLHDECEVDDEYLNSMAARDFFCPIITFFSLHEYTTIPYHVIPELA